MKNQRMQLALFSFLLLFIVNDHLAADVVARIIGPASAVAGQSTVYSVNVYDPNSGQPPYVSSYDWKTSGDISGMGSSAAVIWDLPGKYSLSVIVYLVYGGPRYASLEVEVSRPKEPDPNLPVIELPTSDIYQLEDVQVNLNTKTFNVENIVWSGTNMAVKSGQGSKNPTVIFSRFGDNRIQAAFNFVGSSELKKTAMYPEIKPIRTEILGPDMVCDEAIFSLEGLPQGTQISWGFASGTTNFSILSGQGTNTVTTKLENGKWGDDMVYAYLTYQGQEIKVEKRITAVYPYVQKVVGPTYARIGVPQSFYATPDYFHGVCDYNWVVGPSDGVSQSPIRYSNTITFSQTGTYRVGCYISNTPCGRQAGPEFITVEVGSFYLVTFDATSSTANISLSDRTENNASVRNYSKINYQIYNQANGQIMNKGQMEYSGGSLDLSSFNKGVYIIKIQMENNVVETHRLLK